jgi:hypothetical protein
MYQSKFDGEMLSTVDLFVLTGLDQLLLNWKDYLLSHLTSYLNNYKVNRTEHSPTVSVVWL